MSGTKHIVSLSIAQEASFGSPDLLNGTGLPDASVLSFVSMECERAPIVVPGEAPVDERADTRAQPYFLPPEADTVCDSSGNAIPRRTGTIQVDTVITNIGDRSTFATIANLPLHMLFNAVFQTSAAAANSDAVLASSTDTRFEPTTLASFTEGQGICVDIDGKGEYSFVTDLINGGGAPNDFVVHSPAMSRGLNAVLPDSVRLMQTYSVAPTLGNLGASVALRADGDGWRTYMVGCRPVSCAVSTSPHMVKLSWTIQFAHAYDDNNNADVLAGTNITDPVVADGCVSHMLQCYTVVSTQPVNGVTAPAEMDRDTMAVDTFEANLTWTLAPQGTSENIMGISDYEVTDFAAEVSLMASAPLTNSITQQSFYDRGLHSLLIGLGPVGAGNGFCMYLPAAALFKDPNVLDFGNDSLRTMYSFKQGGPWSGDDSASAQPANTVFRLAWAN